MVSQEFLLFQTYKQQAEALKDSAQVSLDLLNELGDFTGAQKYLAKRAGLNQSMQDELARGGKQTKAKLKELIEELKSEIKEINNLLSRISVLSIDAFHSFQRSALTHQRRQSEILTSLMNKEISYLNTLEHHIHSRTNSLEQSHNRFREKLYEVLLAIINENPKATIANAYADCIAFLLLYVRDDQELALPRHTYIELVEQEQYGPARFVLGHYFTSDFGGHVNKKLEKAGLRRRAREDYERKVHYEDLDADKQKEVDGIVKDSLLKMLEGAELQHPQSGQMYYWKDIKEKIGEVYKGESKITKDVKDSLKTIIDNFYTKLIKEYGAFALSGNGFNSFVLKGSENDAVTVGLIRNKNYLDEDENIDELKEMMKLMETATHNSNVLESLVNQGTNKNLFVDWEDNGNSTRFGNTRSRLWEPEKIREYFIDHSDSVFTQLNTVKELINNDDIDDIDILKNTLVQSKTKFKEILEGMLGINTSSNQVSPQQKDLFFRNLAQVQQAEKTQTDLLLTELFLLYYAIFINQNFDKVFLIGKIESILNLVRN
ncbi:MAG: hypothetical protein ACLFPL_03830 [Candidatus Nanoarchaeia archaeon]